MTVDIFLKLDDVKGESIDSKHAEEIEVISWGWGMSQSGTTHQGSGGGAGKVNVRDLSLTKYVDKSSPALLLACCNGKHWKEAMLTVRKAGGEPLEYLKITMTEVIVSSISHGSTGATERLTDVIKLNFAKFKTEYTPQKPDGSGGPVVEATWNIAQNRAE